MKQWNEDRRDCTTCLNIHKCRDCHKDYHNCSINNYKYYANEEDVMDMVAWSVAGGLKNLFSNCIGFQDLTPESMETILTNKKKELLRGMYVENPTPVIDSAEDGLMAGSGNIGKESFEIYNKS